MNRKPYIEINISSLLHNVDEIKRQTPSKKRIAVIKANAYGHGAVEIAQRIGTEFEYLAVAHQEEAIHLRKNGITYPILILSPFFDPETVLDYHLTPTIQYIQDLKIYNEHCKNRDVIGKFHLKLNTGMNRFGLSLDEVKPFVLELQQHQSVFMEGVFSHFATTKKEKPHYVQKQISCFDQMLELIYTFQKDIPFIHISNSKNTIDYPELPYNTVRIGNLLYGFVLSEKYVPVRKLFRIVAPILAVQTLKKGESIGYGATFTAKKNMIIGIIAMGNYDGYGWEKVIKPKKMKDRLATILSIFQTKKEVFLGNQVLPLVGKPNMQFICIDLSAHPSVVVGTEVEIKMPILNVKESVERKYI